MTYPPQHGAPGWPGDPGYGAPSDPYGPVSGGQSGSYGGGYPPPGQYPAPGGYSPPVSGPPPGQYSGPGYSPGGPPGQFPPGHPDPGFLPPQPPKSGGGAGLVIGIIGGILVLALGVGAVLYFTGVIGTGGESTTTADGDDDAEVGTKESGEDYPSYRGGDWRYIDDLCEQLTIDPYVTGMSEGSPVSDFSFDFGEGQGSMGCVFNYRNDSSSVVLSISIRVEASPEAAMEAYENGIDLSFQDDPTESALPGDWDQAVVRTGGGISETTVNSFAVLEHVSLQVGVGGTGLPYTESEIPDMAFQTIGEMLELTSA
ncbi:hypothetical protein FB566_3946 [Stackebrandtia endophytica]|uniref:Uncharacterized protein n=1 Tax=Stackebrandtia endophytica TaxID=1496996 RepID=A0A543B0K3_9ACTN|nr:hypothetical protein [Stackebrandtia endophytica]TQL78363.1 hypothetical protein FB566_3946 [Stackebrandtia endophytica]